MVRAASSGSPAMMKAPMGAVVLGEALGVVGLAQEVLFRRGGDLGCKLGLKLVLKEKKIWSHDSLI
jgi:hypothetical protein